MALLDDAANPNLRKVRNISPLHICLSMLIEYLQRSHIVETESFKDTFGPKAQRKKPRLDVGTFEELSKLGGEAAERAEEVTSVQVEGSYKHISDHVSIELIFILPLGTSSGPSIGAEFQQTHADVIEPIYAKGTSRRIYGELYKVIDSSDVILHIIDARDPMGTLCESVLEYIKKEKAHKQVVLVINKCDLVPNWVTVCTHAHIIFFLAIC